MLQPKANTPKQLLAYTRNGDYAHPGEEEAIEIVMKNIVKNPNQLLLDVGCGMGGTAKYIKNNKWGIPIGIDIDETAISYAKKTYPDITFLLADVTQASNSIFDQLFDVVYLFNSFYAFTNQELALKELFKVSNPGAQLILFDYMQPKTASQIFSPFAPAESMYARKNFIPIDENTIGELLEDSGWHIQSFTNMGEKYISWYATFMSNLKEQQDELIANFGFDLYKWAEGSYSDLLSHLESGTLSGCTIVAHRL